MSIFITAVVAGLIGFILGCYAESCERKKYDGLGPENYDDGEDYE